MFRKMPGASAQVSADLDRVHPVAAIAEADNGDATVTGQVTEDATYHAARAGVERDRALAHAEVRAADYRA